jgi:uncharacterized C2H2 Zn-finger protein
VPRRITVDENGVVVFTEALTAREWPSKPKPDTPPVARGKYEWTGGKSKKKSPKPLATNRNKPRIYKSNTRQTKCPACGVVVRKSRLLRHAQKAHPDKSEYTFAYHLRGGEPELFWCTGCKTYVRGNREKHVCKARPIINPTSSKVSKNQKRKASRHDKPAIYEKNLSGECKKLLRRLHNGEYWVSCSVCGKDMKESKWEKHVGKVHPLRNGQRATVANSSTTSSARPKKSSGQSKRSILDASTGSIRGCQDLREHFEETRYGDKYLGQMRREPDGRFGSLPLYDDYGDESNPS